MYQRIKWSPVEISYLKDHRNDPVNQLCIALAKSRTAIKNKLIEIDTGKALVQSKRKNSYSKIGKRPDLDNLFLRSGWEANLLRLLKIDDSINKIEYEPVDFTFWQFGIKKGTVTYTPDFKITYPDGSYLFIEVKGGWLKPTDKTKLRRFKKYYPDEFKQLVAVTPGPTSKTALFFKDLGIPIKFYYPDLNKKYKNVIPNWE